MNQNLILQAILDPNLSFKAKGIYLAMWRQMETLGRIDTGKLSAMSTDGEAAVRSGIRELIEQGYVTRRMAHADPQNPPRLVTEINHER